MLDDVRQLRHLLALGSHDTIGRAAESLGITKSALTQSIQRMEDINGVRLFDRGRSGTRATIYGERLIAVARRGLALLEQADRELALIRNLEEGRVIIACDPVITELLLAPALTSIMQKYPKLEFVLKSGFWQDLRSAVEIGEVDFFVGVKPDENITAFDVHPIDLPSIVIYCRTGHPLASSTDLALQDIMRFSRIGPYMPDWFFERMENSIGSVVGLRGGASVITNDGGMMRRIISNSDAISGDFRPVLMAADAAGEFSILPIYDDPFGKPLPGVIVLRKDHELPPAGLAIVKIVKEQASILTESDQNFSVSRA